jgi:hypothetical protein
MGQIDEQFRHARTVAPRFDADQRTFVIAT